MMTSQDWDSIEADLNGNGFAILKNLLADPDAAALVGHYDDETSYRSRVVMARHGFGQGEYKYYAYPQPDAVVSLRTKMYPPLAQIANRWNHDLGIDTCYPDPHDAYLVRCHLAGQIKPTPLILKYQEGDYNCLHQDVYGEHVFPLQLAVLLSQPGSDFSGGEFVITEQRPRMQSRVEVVSLERGDAVLFPVRHRPKQGSRGPYRVNMRHGVSRLHTGERYTLGIIFHDAE